MSTASSDRPVSFVNLRISVVIPARNRAEHLPKCLNSVLSQTLRPAEIIVVDDASTDDTNRVLTEYAARGVRSIRLEVQGGAQSARNAGIRHARHDWIAFHDSDDIWLPDKLASQAAALERKENPESTVVHCDGLREDVGNGTIDTIDIALFAGDCYSGLLIQPGPMFQGMLVHRSKLMAIGLLDEACPSYQEWDTAIRLAKHCEFVHLRQPLFVWIWHGGETISRDFRRDLAGFQYVIDKHRDEIIARHGAHGWRSICLKNIVRALTRRFVDDAIRMLAAMPRHSSTALATSFVRAGRLPRGGHLMLRIAARSPL